MVRNMTKWEEELLQLSKVNIIKSWEDVMPQTVYTPLHSRSYTFLLRSAACTLELHHPPRIGEANSQFILLDLNNIPSPPCPPYEDGCQNKLLIMAIKLRHNALTMQTINQHKLNHNLCIANHWPTQTKWLSNATLDIITNQFFASKLVTWHGSNSTIEIESVPVYM